MFVVPHEDVLCALYYKEYEFFVLFGTTGRRNLTRYIRTHKPYHIFTYIHIKFILH